MNRALWLAQGPLAAVFAFAGASKLITWPWCRSRQVSCPLTLPTVAVVSSTVRAGVLCAYAWPWSGSQRNPPVGRGDGCNAPPSCSPQPGRALMTRMRSHLTFHERRRMRSCVPGMQCHSCSYDGSCRISLDRPLGNLEGKKLGMAGRTCVMVCIP